MIDFILSLPSIVSFLVICLLLAMGLLFLSVVTSSDMAGNLGWIVSLLAMIIGGYFIVTSEKSSDGPYSQQPYTQEIVMSDGCIMTQYWKTQVQHARGYSSDFKYVRCLDSKTVTTIELKSCGKNCRKEESITTNTQ